MASEQEYLKGLSAARERHEQARIGVFDVIGESSRKGVAEAEERGAPLPVWQKKGKRLLSTIDNLKTLLSVKGIVVRYNVIAKTIEIQIPNCSFTVDNYLNCALTHIQSQCNFMGLALGTSALKAFLTNIAEENLYNPVAQWIQSVPWDGVSRWQEFCDTLVVAPEDVKMRDILLRRWMLSAIAAAFERKGVSGHGMLVLQGAQGIGKTFWFKRLVPEELGVIQDGVLLDPKDKDSVYQAVTKWMVELGEVDATFRKADISHLKSFITKQTDELRRPFAPSESTFARRTVFFASVNPKTFLHDDTGNRRFWTLACLNIDNEHTIDMQQLWAELYEYGYALGERWVLTGVEQSMLSVANTTFEGVDSIGEMVQFGLDWSAPEDKWEWLTLTKVAERLMRDPKKADVTAVKNKIMARSGVKNKKKDGYMLTLTPPSSLKYM